MQSELVPSQGPAHATGDDPSETDSDRFAFGLSQADVDEFCVLVQRECGESLSSQDAWQRAAEVIALFRMLLGPLPEDQAPESYPQA